MGKLTSLLSSKIAPSVLQAGEPTTTTTTTNTTTPLLPILPPHHHHYYHYDCGYTVTLERKPFSDSDMNQDSFLCLSWKVVGGRLLLLLLLLYFY